MDRLDRLTRRLLEGFDQDVEVTASQCVAPALLEQFAGGDVDRLDRERVESHLDGCLGCLHRFVELRDYLHGVAAPEPASPVLARKLAALLGGASADSPWTRLSAALRTALVFRVPAWAVAGVAVLALVTWGATYKLRIPGAPLEWPVDFSSPGRLAPAHRPASRTVTGVVSSIRDATSDGVEAHFVSLRDTTGATYVLFAWGAPKVGPGDSVEVDGILTGSMQSAGKPVYQGVVTQLRRVR